ncbi:MAG: HEAT repeat domain-containing protein [Methylacidiphilales bacterium]|nr:HEAT repeat domain-containing protein [Candidatus Methylacidiphilales bacterium]
MTTSNNNHEMTALRAIYFRVHEFYEIDYEDIKTVVDRNPEFAYALIKLMEYDLDSFTMPNPFLIVLFLTLAAKRYDKFIEFLNKGVQHNNKFMRLYSYMGLYLFGHEQYYKNIVKILTEECYANDRMYIIDLIGSLKIKELSPILDSTIQDFSSLIKMLTISTLHKLEQPINYELLYKVISGAKGPSRIGCIAFLDSIKSDATIQLLRDMLDKDESAVAKNYIIRTIGRIGELDDCKLIAKLLKQDIDEEMRDSIIQALADIVYRARNSEKANNELNDEIKHYGEVIYENITKKKELHVYDIMNLGKSGDPRALEVILNCLNIHDANIDDLLKGLLYLGDRDKFNEMVAYYTNEDYYWVQDISMEVFTALDKELINVLFDKYPHRFNERFIYIALMNDKIDSSHSLTRVLYDNYINDGIKMLAIDRLLQKNIENKNDIIMDWLRSCLVNKKVVYSSQLIEYTMIALKAYSPDSSMDFFSKLLHEFKFKYNEDIISGIWIALLLFNDESSSSFYSNNKDIFDRYLYNKNKGPKMITM